MPSVPSSRVPLRIAPGALLRVPALLCTMLWATSFASTGAARSDARHGKQAPTTIRLIMVGDTCFARGVEQAAARAEASYPFTRMMADLQSADIAFGNLECALTRHDVAVPKKYNFRASPGWAKRLAAAGFSVVSLANNHSQDYGRRGLADTLQSLREAGVRAAGAGMTLAEAHRPQIIRRKGIVVAFLAYLGMFPAILPIHPSEPSVAMADLPQMKRDIAAARKKAGVVVVSLHAGAEMVRTPTWRQKSLSRGAIDAGADMVVGHHPHVVQAVEHYKGKTIFYSLGNFVFNPSPSFLRDPTGPWSAMAEVTVGPRGIVRTTLIPLRIVDRQPRRKQP
jgi:poly-gamma-glutamate synthesis protein (capsule biosynthesis protein)